MLKPGRQARVKNNKHLHLRRESPRSSRMFLRRPACTRRPPRSRISLIIAKAISTRRLRRHRTAGRLSVLDTPKAFAATTRAHLIHVRCQYAARFTDAFYIYFEGAAHVWTVQVARTSFALSPNHPSRCGTATIALSSRNRTFSETRLLLGFSVSGFPAEYFNILDTTPLGGAT